MKRVSLLLSLLLPLFLHAQISYNRYLDSTCIWYERSHGIGFPTPGCWDGYETVERTRLHIVGWDSLDGEAWHLLHQDVASTTECMGQLVYSNDWEWTSRIREDSSGRIWLKEGAQPALVLYDFQPGLQVADTLWMGDYFYPCAIANIDTVYLGAEPRKRYRCACNSGEPDFVIEGIGFCRGLNLTWGLCGIADVNPRMICFHKGSDSMIVDTIVPCDPPPHITVGIEETDMDDLLRVYWREADESLLLTQLPPGGDLEWTLFDPQGRLLRSGLQADTRIPLPNLSGGLYLFVGRNESGQFAKRFVR